MAFQDELDAFMAENTPSEPYSAEQLTYATLAMQFTVQRLARTVGMMADKLDDMFPNGEFRRFVDQPSEN